MKTFIYIFILIFVLPFISNSQELELNITTLNNKHISYFNSIGIGAKFSKVFYKKYEVEIGYSRNYTNWGADSLNDKDTGNIIHTSNYYKINRKLYYISFLYKLDTARKIHISLGAFLGLQSFIYSEDRQERYFTNSMTYMNYQGFNIRHPLYKTTIGLNIKIEFTHLFFKWLSFVFNMTPGVIIDNKIFNNRKGGLPYIYYPRLNNEIDWGLKFKF